MAQSIDREASIQLEDRHRRARRRLGVVVLGTVAVVALFWALLFASDQRRVEREHSIDLPDSARVVEAMGDASNPLLLAMGIDRGASSIVIIDRADLDRLLDQFTFTDEGWFNQPAPGNRVYQPANVPWPGGTTATPMERFFTSQPPGSGDFANLSVYTLDDETVAVWLYTDWN